MSPGRSLARSTHPWSYGRHQVWKARECKSECRIRGADDAHLSAGDRMREAKEGGVKEETRIRGAAVDAVTDDRTSELGEMHTDLMLLARLEPDQDGRATPRARGHPPASAGTFGPGTELRRIPRPHASHLEGAAIGLEQVRLDDPIVRAWAALDDCQVDAFEVVAGARSLRRPIEPR